MNSMPVSPRLTPGGDLGPGHYCPDLELRKASFHILRFIYGITQSEVEVNVEGVDEPIAESGS